MTAPELVAASPPGPQTAPPGGVLRKILAYGTARAAVEGVLGIRGLVLASLLGPAAFGGWTLVKLWLRYAGLANIGVHRGLERELARARAAPGPEPNLPGRVAVGFIGAVFGTIALASVAASFLVQNPARAFELRAFGAAILTEQLFVYGAVSLRVRADLRALATLELLRAVLQLACTCLLAIRWALPGALAGMVLGNVLALAFLPGRVPLRPAISLPTLRRMLRVGVPVTLTLVIGRLLVTGDRMAVLTFGGRELLGQYAFALSIAGLAGSVAWVVRVVIFPEVYQHAQTSGTRQAVGAHVDSALLPFARLFPPAVGLLALGIRPAVALFAPKFAAAAGAAELLIFAEAAGGLVTIGSVGLVAADRQRVMPKIAVVSTAIKLLASVTLLTLHAPLWTVAAGALLAQGGYGLAVVAFNAHAAQLGSIAAVVARAAGPLAWCVAAVFVVRHLFPAPDLWSTAAAVAAYSVLTAPLLAAMARRVGHLRKR